MGGGGGVITERKLALKEHTLRTVTVCGHCFVQRLKLIEISVAAQLFDEDSDGFLTRSDIETLYSHLNVVCCLLVV